MKKKNVGISEIKICKAPDDLTVLGLGSCVAVAMYHEQSKTGGLVHIMLPEGRKKNQAKPGKYANTAVKKLHGRLKKEVGDDGKIVAKVVGGAQMFKSTKCFSIGEKNITATKRELKKLGIRIIAEDCGKDYGRTITFSPKDGEMKIRCIHGETII
jgi:chemotaxis protein CheD